ncbi:MAG: tryptophan synthase subunit alpha [Chromatiales bacterium]|nr:tryptophan synthase subunit alpha [Chromatiales bacterium]
MTASPRRFAELQRAGPRGPRHLRHRRRSRTATTSLADPARACRSRRRHHRARHAVLRSDGRRPGDPAGQRARARHQGRLRRRARDWCANSARRDAETPLVLMGYLNPIEALGYERFVREARRGRRRWRDRPSTCRRRRPRSCAALREAAGSTSIFLLAPTSDAERIRRMLELAQRLHLLRLAARASPAPRSLDRRRGAQQAGSASSSQHRRCRSASASASGRPRRPPPTVAAFADAVVVGSGAGAAASASSPAPRTEVRPRPRSCHRQPARGDRTASPAVTDVRGASR